MAVMMRSMLEVADNSGARKLQMILPLGGSTGLRAGLGDVITASGKEAAPDGQVQKGKVVKAVIVRTRKEHRRRDGVIGDLEHGSHHYGHVRLLLRLFVLSGRF